MHRQAVSLTMDFSRLDFSNVSGKVPLMVVTGPLDGVAGLIHQGWDDKPMDVLIKSRQDFFGINSVEEASRSSNPSMEATHCCR